MTLRRLLCAIFGHVPAPGITPRLCIFFICVRCNASVPGNFSLTRSKKRKTS